MVGNVVRFALFRKEQQLHDERKPFEVSVSELPPGYPSKLGQKESTNLPVRKDGFRFLLLAYKHCRWESQYGVPVFHSDHLRLIWHFCRLEAGISRIYH